MANPTRFSFLDPSPTWRCRESEPIEYCAVEHFAQNTENELSRVFGRAIQKSVATTYGLPAGANVLRVLRSQTQAPLPLPGLLRVPAKWRLGIERLLQGFEDLVRGDQAVVKGEVLRFAIQCLPGLGDPRG